MSVEWCKRCGSLILFPERRHSCPPGFRVWCLDYDQEEEDGHVIHAHDHQEAAEKWAEWEDSYSADYCIVGGHDVEVCVRKLDEEDGPVKRFRVEGRSEPVYHAEELSADALGGS